MLRPLLYISGTKGGFLVDGNLCGWRNRDFKWACDIWGGLFHDFEIEYALLAGARSIQREVTWVGAEIWTWFQTVWSWSQGDWGEIWKRCSSMRLLRCEGVSGLWENVANLPDFCTLPYCPFSSSSYYISSCSHTCGPLDLLSLFLGNLLYHEDFLLENYSRTEDFAKLVY